MSRRRRPSSAGLVFHVVNRAAKRVPLFEDHNDYLAFRTILAEGVRRFGIAFFAYCLMPNHWHFVLSPTADGALSRFMHWLTTTHARRWQIYRGLDGSGAVYQGRFKAIPISCDRHFLWVCRYVERNALRASLVTSAHAWHWSSLAERGAPSTDITLAEWPVPRPEDWVAHVNTPQTPAELEAFRRAMRRGEPFGDEEWQSRMSIALGLHRPGGPGRPRRVKCPLKMTSDPITHMSLTAHPTRSRR
jgi:putative transposase